MPEYNPWTYVNSFECSKIYKVLSSAYKAVVAGPKRNLLRSGSKSNITIPDRAALTVPSSSEKRRKSNASSGSPSSSTVREVLQGPPKNYMYICIYLSFFGCYLSALLIWKLSCILMPNPVFILEGINVGCPQLFRTRCHVTNKKETKKISEKITLISGRNSILFSI